MQKTVLTFGLIAGLIVVILWHATRPLWTDANGQMNMDLAEIIGYTNMIVALSMIFFGIKQYRDRILGGRISFGRAFKVGILIALVASAIYVIGWMIYYNLFDSAQNFLPQYLEHMKEQMMAKGLPEEEINQRIAGFQKNMELYENPIIMAGMTLMEILPVGLLITLISAMILKKK